MKLKILFCGDASYTLSGYGTYIHEVVSRLHATGKYHIAEFGSYGYVNDTRDSNVKWRFYANSVRPDDARFEQYKSNPAHDFGSWRFEKVLLDFQPDIVVDIRDPWMIMHEFRSPLRRFFHWAIMPTVDSFPQQEEWIDMFSKADGVLAYSSWGLETLRKQGLTNLYKTASPGVQDTVFRPAINKMEHKRKLGFPDDAFIVGSIMRNQKRKLIPNLMDGFNLLLDRLKKEGKHRQAVTTLLYLHTSYPDTMHYWNIPRLLKEKGLGNKVLFSYICANCQNVTSHFFQDTRTVCQKCKKADSILSNVTMGFTKQQLAAVINTWDVYAQYAICEGFGMPMVEAAACGVPVFATDVSAMSSVVRKLNGRPIPCITVRTVEEDAEKGIPINQDFADMLYSHLTLTPTEKQKRNQKAIDGVRKYYLWDQTAKTWENYFDGVELKNLQGKWDIPINLINPASDGSNVPDGLTNAQFVDWCIVNVLGDIQYLDSLLAAQMTRWLNYQVITSSVTRTKQYQRKDVIQRFRSMVDSHNRCEHARMSSVVPNDKKEDFLQYARIKEEAYA